MADYTIRRIEPTDLDTLVALYAASFNETISTDKLARKFATEPFGVAYVGYLAVSDTGQAAAFYGVFPAPMQIGTHQFIGAQSGDTMTHPDHRKQGLFVRLARATFALARELGIELIYGFPNQNSLPGFKRHLDWSFPPPMQGGELRAQQSWLTRTRLRLQSSRARSARIADRLNQIAIDTENITFHEGLDGVVHNHEYLAYKHLNSDSVVVETDRLRAWLVPGTRLDVGALQLTQSGGADALFNACQELLQYCAADRMRFCYSADSEPLHAISEFVTTRPNTDIGYLALAESLEPERLFFSRGDFDYF